MYIKSLSVILPIAATLLLSTTVQADWKGYAGSSCIPISGNADFTRTLDGTYRVNGSSRSFVQCPVVRDIETGAPGRVLRARIRLADWNTREDGYCTFRSRTISGAMHDSQTIAWRGTGDKTLTFDLIDASNWGSYMIRCLIPGEQGTSNRSYIRSYSVEEAK